MNDPLHGVTLKALLTQLLDDYGWDGLAAHVPAARCFQNEPTLTSSLKFLRKTPWARDKVEALYVRDKRYRDKKRARNQQRAERRAFSATMPVERPETLAMFWPQGKKAPAFSSPLPLVHGIDPVGFRAVQQSIGFVVTEAIWSGLDLVPEGMVVAHDEGRPVAVACAERKDEGWAEIAWVAVAPSHRGRGLGRAVCGALMSSLLAAGQDRIFGSTQDERIQALRIYLDLGFRPVKRPEKAERWAAVLEAHPTG